MQRRFICRAVVLWRGASSPAFPGFVTQLWEQKRHVGQMGEPPKWSQALTHVASTTLKQHPSPPSPPPLLFSLNTPPLIERIREAMLTDFDVDTADFTVKPQISDRFPTGRFTIFGSEARSDLAVKVLSNTELLLNGPQGIGKSYFAVALVHQLRLHDPDVVTLYLPSASFGSVDIIRALQIALRKANRPEPEDLEEWYYCTMEEVGRKLHRAAPKMRIVIDQMNHSFRSPTPNINYNVLREVGQWVLFVSSLTLSPQRFMRDFPQVELEEFKLRDDQIDRMLRGQGVEDPSDSLREIIVWRTNRNPLEVYLACQAIAQGGEKWGIDGNNWFENRKNAIKDELLQHEREFVMNVRDRMVPDKRFYTLGRDPLTPAVAAAVGSLCAQLVRVGKL